MYKIHRGCKEGDLVRSLMLFLGIVAAAVLLLTRFDAQRTLQGITARTSQSFEVHLWLVSTRGHYDSRL